MKGIRNSDKIGIHDKYFYKRGSSMQKEFFNDLKRNKNMQFTKQQRQAILHKEGPALILAVPGAGKTTTLITRAAYLIQEEKVDPKKILSLTFSKAAALDMRKRFQSLYGENLSDLPHFSTIHSFAFQVLHREIGSKGESYHFIEGKNPPIHKMELLKQIYQKINKTNIKEESLDELSNAISFVKNRMISRKELKKISIEIKNFEDIFLKYESTKKEKRYIDFDDMLTFSYKILKNNEKVRQIYQKKYTYIQVDEGQDTSPIQYALIKLLGGERDHLFILADDDQSIYGFRGADPKELIDFKRSYPKGKVFYMEENFRSTSTIVDIANDFIKGNKQRYEKNLNTKNPMGKSIIIKKTQNYHQQMEYLLGEIKTRKNEERIAILYRNHLSTVPIVDALLWEGYSFSLKEGKKYFFHHWLTRDILSFMNLALDHRDKKSFEYIYYKMNQYISKKDLEIVKKSPRDQSIFKSLQNLKGLPSFKIKRMIELEEKFLILSTLKPIKAIHYIEKELCYKSFLEDRKKTSPSMVKTAEFILDRLKSMAQNTETLVEFLCQIEELKVEIANTSNKGKDTSNITLSTLHGAKGLEFDRVYMIDLIEDQIPTYGSMKKWEQGDPSLLEEERRLFYVGMTRAKQELTLLGIHSPSDSNQESSQFIEEVLHCIKEKIASTGEKALYKEKEKVIHQTFGKGKIEKIDKENITVVFENHGEKKLAKDFCITRGLLEKAE